MGKRLLNLYVEDNQIELAKSKRINLSELFRNMLDVENGLVKGDEVINLKLQNSKLVTELTILRNINEKLTKEVEEWKNKPKTLKLISRD